MARAYIETIDFTKVPMEFIQREDSPFVGCSLLRNGLWVTRNNLARRGQPKFDLMESGKAPSGSALCLGSYGTKRAAILDALKIRPYEFPSAKAKRVEAQAQAGSDPAVLEVAEDLLDQCHNLFGPIGEDVRYRLRSYLLRPTIEGWEDVSGLIVSMGRPATVWQFWIQEVPDAPRRGPSMRHGAYWDEWDRIPTSLELLLVLRAAATTNEKKQAKA